jgi:RNA polymerase sigma-70 factor, ECF subfamily
MRRQATLEEIESIYRTRLPEFRRVAAAILGDRELAFDAVQDGFALAVTKRASYRGEGTLEGWIWRIVINAARGQRRARRGVEDQLADSIDARGNGLAERPDERVRVAISLLPERQRLVLFLRYYADLDYQSIAGALEVSAGTVGATLNTAHRSLRSVLEEMRHEPA